LEATGASFTRSINSSDFACIPSAIFIRWQTDQTKADRPATLLSNSENDPSPIHLSSSNVRWSITFSAPSLSDTLGKTHGPFTNALLMYESPIPWTSVAFRSGVLSSPAPPPLVDAGFQHATICVIRAGPFFFIAMLFRPAPSASPVFLPFNRQWLRWRSP